MNDGHDDQILDSFLDEMLTNQHPPDLTEQIQARLRAELGPERFQQLRTRRMVKPSLRTPSWTNVSVAVLTLAAGLMLAIALWQYWPGAAKSDGVIGGSEIAKSDPPVTSDANPVKPEVIAPQVATAPKAKELSLEQLPFSPDVPVPELASRPPAAAPVAAMEDKEIVRWLDERFTKLWDNQGIAAAPAVDNDQWMAQTAKRLVGATQSPSAQSPQELSEKLVRTVAFAESFADRIAGYWLKGTAEADPKHPAGQALRGYLAQQIVAKKPWNEVLSALVDSRPDEPQAVWLASLAGGGNHRLAGRLGSALLDEALACARCHDASDNGRVVSMDQDDYWSLVAIFSGIDGKVTKPTEASPTVHQLVDNQQQLFEGAKLPVVYFDRPDGRVQAARYRLPGGDDWRTMDGVHTPRESLARWIKHSSVTDQASVNLAWRLVFGRPLVAQHAALDGEGYAQRREILSMLAEQFQAHDRDLGQLVTWLVSSVPFARGTLNVDRSRWLTASEDEIVNWSSAATNFAARLPDLTADRAVDRGVKSLESAVVRIDKWSSSRDERWATLAQRTPASSTNSKPIAKEIGSEPTIGYLIHSVKPNYSQSLFINRLVKSKLSWQQQVDHIAGLIGEPAGNARLHATAQKILDAKNGDRSAALFQLLQGALLCHEEM